jgi:hypothetical protein
VFRRIRGEIAWAVAEGLAKRRKTGRFMPRGSGGKAERSPKNAKKSRAGSQSRRAPRGASMRKKRLIFTAKSSMLFHRRTAPPGNMIFRETKPIC